MKIFKNHIDARSARPIIGFSLYWAWIDAALVGAPLARSVASNNLFGDFTSMVSVLFCMVTYFLCFCFPKLSLLTRKKAVRWVTALSASAGTLLVSSFANFSAPVVTIGLALIGLGMAGIVIMWADGLASDEQNRGYIWVAGSIALSFPLYLFSIELSDWIRPFVIAGLPLASCALLTSPQHLSVLPKRDRAIVSRCVEDTGSPYSFCIMGFSCNVAFWFFSFGLVFGIMQHLFIDSQLLLNSVLMDFQQGGRALAAVIFFVGLCVFSWKPHTTYRISTSIVLIGLVLVPLVGTNGGFAAGFISHMAYGFFECMTWAIVFEAMRIRKADAGAVAGAARLLSAAGLFAGTLIVVLARDTFASNALQMQSLLSSSVCILVIATMMVLDISSDNNVWTMMKAGTLSNTNPSSTESRVEGGLESAVSSLGQEYGLTRRETQIFMLLAQGRTSPYISSELLIGVNTVNTHKRRIYQKLGVHDKQELIDMVKELLPEGR